MTCIRDSAFGLLRITITKQTERNCMKQKQMIAWVASCAMVLFAGLAQAADPAVKKSSSGICHDESSPNYKQLKDFTPYKTIDACLKSGGKMPAGVTAPAAAPASGKSSDAGKQDTKPAQAQNQAQKQTQKQAQEPAAAPKSSSSKSTASGQIKKSNSGICHAPGTEYYDRTQNFEPFRTMADCIKSGGREPK